MNYRRKLSPSMSLFVLLSVLVATGVAAPALGQCPWDGAAMCDPSGAPPYSMCTRPLALPPDCGAPVNNGNGTVCAPSMAATGLFQLMATQSMATFRNSAYCRWACTYSATVTGICRINLSDGLPVELMEFSIGIDEPADGDDSQGEAEDESDPAR